MTHNQEVEIESFNCECGNSVIAKVNGFTVGYCSECPCGKLRVVNNGDGEFAVIIKKNANTRS